MRIPLLISLLAGLVPAMASSQEWCTAPICARFEGSDLIRIRAPGRFEVTFTKAVGLGSELYDLVADPGKLYDVSDGDNGILWTKIEQIDDGSSYFANNATSLELLEASGVRVRARHSGKHHRYGMAGMPWNDLGYTQTFTIYATGEMFVDYALIASRDIDLYHLDLIVDTTGAWGPNAQGAGANEAHCVGQYGLGLPYAGTASPFAMASSNGSHYFADVLMATYANVHDGSYWNEGYLDFDFRCGLYIYDFHPTLETGTTHLPIMLRVAEDMNDAAGGAKYTNAYRSPDAALSVTQGVKVLNDPGDFDGDGFDETEGAYMLRRQPGQDVELTLHAGIPRPSPVFEILEWNQPVPAIVLVDGVPRTVGGAQVRASTAGGALIVQLLGDRTANTQVHISGEPVQVPALPGLAGAALAAALGALGARRIARGSRTS